VNTDESGINSKSEKAKGIKSERRIEEDHCGLLLSRRPQRKKKNKIEQT